MKGLIKDCGWPANGSAAWANRRMLYSTSTPRPQRVQFVESNPWIEHYNISYFMAWDGSALDGAGGRRRMLHRGARQLRASGEGTHVYYALFLMLRQRE